MRCKQLGFLICLLQILLEKKGKGNGKLSRSVSTTHSFVSDEVVCVWPKFVTQEVRRPSGLYAVGELYANRRRAAGRAPQSRRCWLRPFFFLLFLFLLLLLPPHPHGSAGPVHKPAGLQHARDGEHQAVAAAGHQQARGARLAARRAAWQARRRRRRTRAPGGGHAAAMGDARAKLNRWAEADDAGGEEDPPPRPVGHWRAALRGVPGPARPPRGRPRRSCS